MSATKYSKNNYITPSLIKDRKYKIQKLSAFEISTEGFKITKAILPSVGVGIDSIVASGSEDALLGFDTPRTASSMFQLLSENLEIEHYTTLVDKLLGSMFVSDTFVDDWSDHFDEHPEDFLEILMISFKENFYDFFMESTILSPMKEKVMEVVLPMLTGRMKNESTSSEQEDSEE